MKRVFIQTIGHLLLTLFVMQQSALAQSVSKEYQLKAAFLFKFLNFVEWESPDSTKVLCVYGENPFGNSLNELIKVHEGKYNSTRVIVTRSLQELSECNILFISRSETNNLDYILPAIQNRPIMSVSDVESFVDDGGIVELITQESRIRFIINQQQAKKMGINISSQLLALAQKVVVE